MLQPISITLLTKNSHRYLHEVLLALRHFDEVLMYDTGSTDHSFDIASQHHNVKIVQGPFIGFGPTHNQASVQAKNDWILSIDSDEVVSPAMYSEISQLILQEDLVYSFPRHNYFNGKWIKWCGWYPDRQIRLYHRKKTQFTDAQVHEAIIADHMQHRQLNGAIIHYSYESIGDFLTKMQSYSELFALQNMDKKNSSPWKAIAHGFFAFFKSYLIKRGVLGGYEGFLISAYNGHTAFYKYLKLYEKRAKFKGFQKR